MMLTLTIPAIKPYSIAVAPLSSRKKFITVRFCISGPSREAHRRASPFAGIVATEVSAHE